MPPIVQGALLLGGFPNLGRAAPHWQYLNIPSRNFLPGGNSAVSTSKLKRHRRVTWPARPGWHPDKNLDNKVEAEGRCVDCATRPGRCFLATTLPMLFTLPFPRIRCRRIVYSDLPPFFYTNTFFFQCFPLSLTQLAAKKG